MLDGRGLAAGDRVVEARTPSGLMVQATGENYAVAFLFRGVAAGRAARRFARNHGAGSWPAPSARSR